MKITLSIDDSVMRRLKKEAARRGVTLSALVEDALRRFLGEPVLAFRAPGLLPSFDGGGARIDVADRDALYQAMEGR